jgi:hypothetical protein
MRMIALASLAFSLALSLTACGAGDAPDPSAATAPTPADATSVAPTGEGIPGAPESYRRGLDRAWRDASAGKNPTMACTGVIARAAGNPPTDGVVDADAIRAFELCYIDVRVRYLQSILAGIAPGRSPDENANDCGRILAHQVIAQSSLGTFAKNVQLDPAQLDQRVRNALLEAMQQKCPDHVDIFAGDS